MEKFQEMVKAEPRTQFLEKNFGISDRKLHKTDIKVSHVQFSLNSCNCLINFVHDWTVIGTSSYRNKLNVFQEQCYEINKNNLLRLNERFRPTRPVVLPIAIN